MGRQPDTLAYPEKDKMPDPKGVLARISVGLLAFVLPRHLITTPQNSNSGTLFD